MIWLICCSAIIMLFAFFNAFQVDSNNYMRYSNSLKYVCESASFNGAQYLHPERYADGVLVFDDEESLKTIKHTIMSELRLDDAMNPIGMSVVSDPIEYVVYFVDESLQGRVYVNGNLSRTFTFTFPYTYTDSSNGFSSKVSQPAVFVKIDLGEVPLRGGSVKSLNLTRTASYELTERTR